MIARITRQNRVATQSGTAKTKAWLLRFISTSAHQIDPLMGWTGSGDTLPQVEMWFDTQEEAVAYVTKHGLPYRLEIDQTPSFKIKSYSDNFRSNRIGLWTH